VTRCYLIAKKLKLQKATFISKKYLTRLFGQLINIFRARLKTMQQISKLYFTTLLVLLQKNI